MGIIHKIIIILDLLLLLFVSGYSQIVIKHDLSAFSKDSINFFVVQFWKNTHDDDYDYGYPVSNIDDLSFRKLEPNFPNEYYPFNKIDSTFYKLCLDSNNIIALLAHTNQDIDQILLINNTYIYLIDMRNPLQKIVNNITNIPEFSADYKKRIIDVINVAHKRNWYRRHISDLDIENEVEKIYDPSEW